MSFRRLLMRQLRAWRVRAYLLAAGEGDKGKEKDKKLTLAERGSQGQAYILESTTKCANGVTFLVHHNRNSDCAFACAMCLCVRLCLRGFVCMCLSCVCVRLFAPVCPFAWLCVCLSMPLCAYACLGVFVYLCFCVSVFRCLLVFFLLASVYMCVCLCLCLCVRVTVQLDFCRPCSALH